MFDRQTSWFPELGEVCWTISDTEKVKMGWNEVPEQNTSSLGVWALQKVKQFREAPCKRPLQSFAVSIFPLLLADAQ